LIDCTPILLSRYADETSIILDGTEISLKESVNELNMFAKVPGLKINFGKTGNLDRL